MHVCSACPCWKPNSWSSPPNLLLLQFSHISERELHPLCCFCHRPWRHPMLLSFLPLHIHCAAPLRTSTTHPIQAAISQQGSKLAAFAQQSAVTLRDALQMCVRSGHSSTAYPPVASHLPCIKAEGLTVVIEVLIDLSPYSLPPPPSSSSMALLAITGAE